MAAGVEWWTVAVRARGDDALAGYTRVAFEAGRPEQAWQGWTLVGRDHRQRGLARWVKAAATLRLLAERPVVAQVDTWNAVTNTAMLGINVEMSFRPLLDYGDWQLATAGLARFVRR